MKERLFKMNSFSFILPPSAFLLPTSYLPLMSALSG